MGVAMAHGGGRWTGGEEGGRAAGAGGEEGVLGAAGGSRCGGVSVDVGVSGVAGAAGAGDEERALGAMRRSRHGNVSDGWNHNSALVLW